jgi:hypothetical protein
VVVKAMPRARNTFVRVLSGDTTRGAGWRGGQRNTATNRQARTSPAPGVNEQNHRLTKSIQRSAVAQLAASISDLDTRVKSVRCPFHRNYFYFRELSGW